MKDDNVQLTHRVYNGLDERQGWPIVLTKPIETINQLPVIPVGKIVPRAPKSPTPTLLERFLNWLAS